MCGLGNAVSVAMLPMWAPIMKGMQEQADAQIEEQARAEMDALEAQEAAAETEEQKAEIRRQRETKKVIVPMQMDMGKMFEMYEDPMLIGYGMTDGIIGALLNLFLLISGIGLLNYRDWARKMALWVAGLKIVKLLVLQGFAIAVVVPNFAKNMGAFVDDMIAKVPGGGGANAPPPGTIATIYGVTGTAGMVVFILVALIYPIVTLWLLNKPAAKAACQAPATDLAEAR